MSNKQCQGHFDQPEISDQPESSGQRESSGSFLTSSAEAPTFNAERMSSENLANDRPKHARLYASLSTPAPGTACHLQAQSSTSTEYVEGRPNRPRLDRMASLRSAISHGATLISSGSSRISNKTAKFFGVLPTNGQVAINDPKLKWVRRRLRYINRRYSRYGGYKEEEAQKELGEPTGNLDVPLELATPPVAVFPPIPFFEQLSEVPSSYEAQLSVRRSISEDSGKKEKLLVRDSIAKMTLDGLSSLVHRGSTRGAVTRQSSTSFIQRERALSISFAPVVMQPKNISTSRRSSTSPNVDGSPRIASGSPFPLGVPRCFATDRELGSSDSRRSGKVGYEGFAIAMSKIEEESPSRIRSIDRSNDFDSKSRDWRGTDFPQSVPSADLPRVKKRRLLRQEELLKSKDFGRMEIIGPSGVTADAQPSNLFQSVNLERRSEEDSSDSVLQIFPEKIDSFTAKEVGKFGISMNEMMRLEHQGDDVLLEGKDVDIDKSDKENEDEEFFGVDQISLDAEEDFNDVGTEFVASSATFGEDVANVARAVTSIPRPDFIPQENGEKGVQNSTQRIFRFIPSAEERDITQPLLHDIKPLERPSSLNLTGLSPYTYQSTTPKFPLISAADGFFSKENAEPNQLKYENMDDHVSSNAVTPFLERYKKIKESFQGRKRRLPRSRFYGVGFGLWRQLLRRRLNKVDRAIADEIESFEDHRPFFTYYVTSVQILVCLVSIFFHGFGPVGFDRREQTASVLHTSVVLRRVSIYELENFWFGPSFPDLVHLGAKYSPCMRRDPQIYEQIERERMEENQTGCCIYNDGVGCFQASRNECPSLIAVLVKWSESNKGPNGRTSGAVCGQDPNYCEEPLSTPPYAWPDDITKWPVCRRRSATIPEDQKHLHCEITGRPCCILLHGQCRITTKEYCDFVHGYYHANATLCSQVSCLSEVCGMLPFLYKDTPDQFYRLFLSLFLHAGILHCALTVLTHWFYMRDLEKLIGCGRMALLYMGSGVGGNLASALLMPYKPEVGPSGSLVGIFTALYADVFYNWKLIEKPWGAIKELGVITFILFAAGLLPWIDNWAHIFGFIFGLLICLGTFPYIDIGNCTRRKRKYIVIACWFAIIALYAFFFLRFYKWPKISWKWTEYINCYPFTDHMCDNQGVELKAWLKI